jgi:farnesyl diphosphate synthase
MGLSEAKRFASELLHDSHEAVAGFGDRALRLKEIADFIVHRQR